MRRFVCAAVVAVCAVSIALADDIRVVITKVEGDTITYKKAVKKGEDAGPEMTATIKKAKIYKGKFNKDTKKVEADKDNPIELANFAEMVTKGGKGGKKGGFAVITTDDGGKTVTQIIYGGGKKGKKKKDAN